MSDLAPLASCPLLVKLDIIDTEVMDLAALSGLKELSWYALPKIVCGHLIVIYNKISINVNVNKYIR